MGLGMLTCYNERQNEESLETGLFLILWFPSLGLQILLFDQKPNFFPITQTESHNNNKSAFEFSEPRERLSKDLMVEQEIGSQKGNPVVLCVTGASASFGLLIFVL